MNLQGSEVSVALHFNTEFEIVIVDVCYAKAYCAMVIYTDVSVQEQSIYLNALCKGLFPSSVTW